VNEDEFVKAMRMRMREIDEDAALVASALGAPPSAGLTLLAALTHPEIVAEAAAELEDPSDALAREVQMLRTRESLTVEALASEAGVAPGLISEIEAGVAQAPSVTPSAIGRLAKRLGRELLRFRPTEFSEAWSRLGSWSAGPSGDQEGWIPPTARGLQLARTTRAPRARQGERTFRLADERGVVRIVQLENQKALQVRLRNAADRPLVAWTIEAWEESGVKTASTDDDGLALMSRLDDPGAVWVRIVSPNGR
jgi:transcriptional regulator with XRE-family HTH domain